MKGLSMNWFARIFTGLGFGSFVYLFVSLFNQNPVLLTEETIWSIFLISACAGVSSILFDIEQFNYFTALFFHFVLINIVVLSTALFNDFLGDTTWGGYFTGMLVFYGFSWLFFIIRNRIIARELNHWIKRNSERNLG